MGAVEELHDVEAAFVDIEVDVSRLKGRRAGLPDPCVRIQAFDFLPGGETDAFAVGSGTDKQEIQMVVLCAFVDLQHEAADDPAIFADAVSDTVMDAALDRLPGDDFAGLLAMAVAMAEILHRAVFECALVVENSFSWSVLLRQIRATCLPLSIYLPALATRVMRSGRIRFRLNPMSTSS